jgi:hypothetical protein
VLRLLDQYSDLYAPLLEATTQRLAQLEDHD